MKTFRYIFSLLAVLALFSSCGKKSPEKIFEEAASGVVLILNEQYYSLDFGAGMQIYFTGIADGMLRNVTFDPKEAEKNKNIFFGTGFFVSEKGEILTNRHVAAPNLDTKSAVATLRSSIGKVRRILEMQVNALVEEYSVLETRRDTYESEMSVGWYFGTLTEAQIAHYTKQIEEVNIELARLEPVIAEYSAAVNKLYRMDYSAATLRSHSKVGIAYNDTFVSSSADFIPCTVTKISNDEDVDLALLQLKSKKTPEAAYVFDVRAAMQESPADKVQKLFDETHGTLKVNDALLMIGYNAGIQLAATKQGIKAQLTSGNVSQQPDGDRLLYTVPTLGGSSGSPILNEKGQLVAVNFAKVGDTQNFNFGIPLHCVMNFLGMEQQEQEL